MFLLAIPDFPGDFFQGSPTPAGYDFHRDLPRHSPRQIFQKFEVNQFQLGKAAREEISWAERKPSSLTLW